MKEVSTKNTIIGWIGTGVMGQSMCKHVINSNYSVCVYNRTQKKAEPLIELGAEWKDSPAQIANEADIIFTIVGYPEDVRGVYFGDNGIINGLRSETVLVDMTTTEPSLAEEIYKAANSKDAYAIDAPVSGGDVGAKKGTLSIMVGGDESIFQHILPLLNLMGKNIVYQGSAGKGQHTKMVNQITIAGTMIGVCEALVYAYKSGLDIETVLESISKGAAGCWTLDNLAPRISKRNFDPGFFIDHFVKDMGIALKESAKMKLSLPGLALVHQLYVSLQAKGKGKLGTQGIILALEELSGVTQ